MKRFLFALSLCAALHTSGGGAFARAPQNASKQQTPKKNHGAAPAERKAGASAATNASAHSERPKVREIKEGELKSLLEASAAAGRPLLVNFWATWCVPCREEFPDLVKIDSEFSEKLDFVTVSLDDVSEIETNVPGFLGEVRAARIPAYLLNADDPDAAINLVDKTWHGELPATFLYDRAGKVVFSHKGRIKPDELRAAIRATLE